MNKKLIRYFIARDGYDGIKTTLDISPTREDIIRINGNHYKVVNVIYDFDEPGEVSINYYMEKIAVQKVGIQNEKTIISNRLSKRFCR